MENEGKTWAESVAKHLEETRGKKEFVCEGMWSPSGFFHIGNARAEIFTPFAVAKALRDRGNKAVQNFIIDDFDGIRKVPEGLGIKKEDEDRFIGVPYALAESPFKGFKNWADAFSSQAVKTVPEYGVDLEVYSAHQLYKEGAFNDLIEKSLDNAEKIRKIWMKLAKAKKEEGFLSVQMLCEECNKVLFTKALKWNGKTVEYECRCGFKGERSPLNGNSKLHWRVHWVAHWLHFKVDFESGGKDHFTKGGSVEMGHALIREVFGEEPPYGVPTEFIQVKGKKMSGSVGNIINLRDWLEVAGPEEFRFMNFSYKPQTSIEFSFEDNSFILLMENFERAGRIYYGLDQAQGEKLTQQIKRAYELSMIEAPPKKMPSRISYRFAVMLSQLMDEEKEFEKIQGILKDCSHIEEKKLSGEEIEKMKVTFRRARNWLGKYAPEEFKIKFAEKIPKEVKNSNAKIKETINEIADELDSAKTAEDIQNLIYVKGREKKVDLRELFKTIYLLVIGKTRGPKICTLILALGKEKVKKRMQEIA